MGDRERIAKLLGWSVADTQSLSLPALRDLVRPLSATMAHEIDQEIQTGRHISRRSGLGEVNGMDIKIAKHGWVQVGGDINPGTYGGTIATANGQAIEMIKIQPVREYVGDREAVDVGHPFWTREGYFDLDDLSLDNEDVESARESSGLDDETLRSLQPESRAMAIAEALLDYGHGDEGEAGWAKDIIGNRMVKWWGSKRAQGWRYLADEDVEFRRLLRKSR